MPKIKQELEPFWTTADGEHVKLYLGNVIDVLRELPEKSVHMSVTSPPYWGLRDYGTGEWSGGDPNCNHEVGDDKARPERYGKGDKQVNVAGCPTRDVTRAASNRCGKCGAKRIDFQIGSESIPDCGVSTSPYLELRDDLTDDEKSYVISELTNIGIL